ncbi:MAG: uL15 family ribosomal protein [Clostridia bacterium]|nr:uL15 family ribosomal protein [Clostridia bacterium]
MALLNTLMAINLINGNIWLYAAILVVALVAVFFLALRKVEVVYVDPDEDYEIAHTKYGWGRKIDVATANKNGKIFVGWSYDENGEKRLGKKQIRVWKSTELYAVWQKPVVGITVEDANAVLEITFKNKDGEEISKEIRPFAIDIPEEADGEKILGWNYEDAENESAGIIASDKEKNIIPVNLVPVYESSDEAVAEEPAYEEPVVEEEAVADEEVAVADEEPVAEEVVAEEQVAEEPVAEEPVVEDEAVAEEVAEEAAPVEPIIVPTYVDGQGRKINIRYSRSIQANVIQAEDKVKNYYSELKNHILSYKGVKSRFSWKFDSYNKGREQLFKIKVRGKTVCLYCALNPEEFDKSKYHHEAVDAKMLADVPMLVKVKSDLGLKKAKELVDIVMAKHEIVVNPKAVSVDYVNEYPYEETDALVQRGLIKVLEADENDVKIAAPAEDAVAEEVVVEEQVAEEVVAEEPVVEDEAVAEEVAEEPLFEEVIEEPIPVDDEPVVEEEAVAEEVVAEEEPVAEEEAVAEEVVADEEPVVEEEAVAEEEPVAEEEAVAEEVVANEEPVAEEEAVAEEVVADEEPVVEEEAVAEEVVADEEPVAEEEAVAEEVVADEEPVVEEEVVAEEIAPATSVEEMHIVESVSADEVDDLVVDEVVDSLVEEDVEYITKDDNKKAIVNIDTISQSYEAGEVVDLASLKAKGLIHKKSKSVKILARGSIDKALTVKAAEFSETALKMIVLTGGKAVHTVSKVK